MIKIKNIRIPSRVQDEILNSEHIELDASLERDGDGSVAYLLVVVRVLVAHAERARAKYETQLIDVAELRQSVSEIKSGLKGFFAENYELHADTRKAIGAISFNKIWAFIVCFLLGVVSGCFWIKMRA